MEHYNSAGWVNEQRADVHLVLARTQHLFLFLGASFPFFSAPCICYSMLLFVVHNSVILSLSIISYHTNKCAVCIRTYMFSYCCVCSAVGAVVRTSASRYQRHLEVGPRGKTANERGHWNRLSRLFAYFVTDSVQFIFGN